MTESPVDLSGLSGPGRALAELSESILQRWLEQVRREVPLARGVSRPVLVDTLPGFLRNLAESLTPGSHRSIGTETTTMAQEHGGERARLTDYQARSVIDEYRILKEVIFDRLEANTVPLTTEHRRIINTSVDVAIREAITAFVLVQADLREQFAATLTHDLRNPLGAIAMAASQILRRPDSPAVPTLAGRVLESAKRIDRMLQDLLDATIFRGGGRLELEIAEFDLKDLVEETLAEMALQHGNRFRIEGAGIRGYWDRDALKRALENLLGNAEKYGDPGTEIFVRLGSTHGRVVLRVHNEGPPIPPDEQEAIFKVFLRTQSARSGKKKGWGLGLALVRAVAESHGGSIGVDSEIGRGTTFLMDIPLDARPFQDVPITEPNDEEG